MKLKQLSAAIMATSAFASAAYAQVPTVYGKVNASLQQIEEERLGATEQDNWEMLSNASRIGVKGSLDINESLKAIYKLEYELFVDADDSGDNDSEFEQRNTYIGLQGNLGTVIVGRHDTPTKLAQGDVDRFNDLYAGDIKYFMAGEQREDNIVIYSTPKFADAFAVNVAFMPGEDSGTSSDDDDGIADYLSASVTYEIDMLYLALATDQDVDNSDIIRLVGEFRGSNFKVGAIYQTAEESDNDEGGMGGLSGIADEVIDILEDNNPSTNLGLPIVEQDAYIISGEFSVTDTVILKAQYGYSESTHEIGTDVPVVGGNKSDTELTQIAFGVDYQLSKAAKVFAYYAMIEAENSDIDDVPGVDDDSEDTTFGIGYELKF